MSNAEFTYAHTEADIHAELATDAAAANGAWDNFASNDTDRQAIQTSGTRHIEHARDHYERMRDGQRDSFRDVMREVDGDLTDAEIIVPDHIGKAADEKVEFIDSLRS